MHLLRFLPALLLAPFVASAQMGALNGIVSGIAPSLPDISAAPSGGVTCSSGSATACAVANTLVYLMVQGRLTILFIAIVVAVVAGFRLVVSQTDEGAENAKRALAGITAGIFVVFLVEPIVRTLYGGIGSAPNSVWNTAAGASAALTTFGSEVFGIVRWFESVAGMIAVGVIVLQAIRIVASFGREDTIRQAYKAIGSTILGLLMIAFNVVFAVIFGVGGGPPSAGTFIAELFGFVRFLLTLTGMAVVGVVIYSGVLLIIHGGQEELKTKAKNAIGAALIGLALIMLSFVLVETVAAII